MAKPIYRKGRVHRYPARVDARTAKLAYAVAAIEHREPAQLVGEALALWLRLPTTARRAYRTLLAEGSPARLTDAAREAARGLLAAHDALIRSGVRPDLALHFPDLVGRGRSGSATNQREPDTARAAERTPIRARATGRGNSAPRSHPTRDSAS